MPPPPYADLGGAVDVDAPTPCRTPPGKGGRAGADATGERREAQAEQQAKARGGMRGWMDKMHDALESARHYESRRASAELYVLGYGVRLAVRMLARLLTSEAMATVEAQVNRWVQDGGAEKVIRSSLVLPEDVGAVARAAASRPEDGAQLTTQLDEINARLARIESALARAARASRTWEEGRPLGESRAANALPSPRARKPAVG